MNNVNNSETILWAVKIGDPDTHEQIITTNPAMIEKASEWAKANGFHKLRIAKIDMNDKPDFIKTFANGGVVGQEITFDFQGDDKEGVIKEITDMGDFIVTTNDGRTVLAEERDVIKLGGMHKNESAPERKKRFGLFEAGGDLNGQLRELKGYRVNIFSSDYKSDLNLLNGKNSAILVTDGKTGDSSTVMSNEPYLKLITKERFNRTGTYMYAEPVNYGKEGDWRMFGGTFVWSSDSRFRDKVSEQPIQLHDRVEYAKGGMTEHGLEIGDEILGYTKKVNELHVKNSNNAEWHSVDLDDGKRYENGGGVNEVDLKHRKIKVSDVDNEQEGLQEIVIIKFSSDNELVLECDGEDTAGNKFYVNPKDIDNFIKGDEVIDSDGYGIQLLSVKNIKQYADGGSIKKYIISAGHDHFNDKPLFRVVSSDNDYVGEWHSSRADAKEELDSLINSEKMATGGPVDVFQVDQDLLYADFNKIRMSEYFQRNTYWGETYISIEGGYYEVKNGQQEKVGRYFTTQELADDLKKIEGRNYSYGIKKQIIDSEIEYDEYDGFDNPTQQVIFSLIPTKLLKPKQEEGLWSVLVHYEDMTNKESTKFWRKQFTIDANSREEAFAKALELFHAVKANKNRKIQLVNGFLLKPKKTEKMATGGGVDEIDLFFAGLGNGTSVFDRNRLERNQYKLIAHISDEGKISYIDKNLPSSAKKEIEQWTSKYKLATGGGVGKNYYEQYGIGKSKYVVNYYDGQKRHKDGSEFYDIAIFKNKPALQKFLNKLNSEGYKRLSTSSLTIDNKMATGGGVNNANFRKILSQAKKEILSDIKNGTISGPIDNFEDLHDYVDANCYGGLCEMSYEISENYEVENKLFDELDKWIQSGGLNQSNHSITKPNNRVAPNPKTALYSTKMNEKLTQKIIDVTYAFFIENGINYGQVMDLGTEITIDPSTVIPPGSSLKKGSMDGMQIIYDVKSKVYEVSEYMAGPNEDELYIYGQYKSLIPALKSLYKGNSNEGRQPIKKYKKGGKLTSAQQSKFGKVMSEFKDGELHSGSKTGPIVKKRDQAIAIALAEANASKKLATGGGVGKTPANIKMLEGQWQSYDKGIMSGKKDEGYITIRNEEDLQNYINKKLGKVVKNITLTEKGTRYPYNSSNPYAHDNYLVILKNGTEFNLERQYGVPNWSGNVNYVERISIKNIKDIKKMSTGGGVNQKIESSILTEEENDKLKQYIEHRIFENFKEIDTFSSGGGYYHTMILLSNNHIVTINWESGDVQFSYFTYKNIEEYLEDPEDDERGWDNELYRPEITEGIPNYSDLDDKTFLDTMMTNKMSTGGKTKDYTNERKELLVELIDNDIIDEEHGYYKDVQSAIASNDSEQMRAIIDELVTSELIDRDDWNYRTAKRLAKEQKATGGKMTGWKHKNKV